MVFSVSGTIATNLLGEPVMLTRTNMHNLNIRVRVTLFLKLI